MGQRFKIERELSTEDRKAFDRFLSDERPTTDEAWEWVIAHGYTQVSRSAVYGYKFSTEEQLNDLRAISEGVNAWIDVARESGAVGFSEAALMTLARKLMEMLFEMKQEGQDPDILLKISLALSNVTKSGQTLTAIRAAERKQAREEAAEAMQKVLRGKVGQKRSITDQDIAEARNAIFGA